MIVRWSSCLFSWHSFFLVVCWLCSFYWINIGYQRLNFGRGSLGPYQCCSRATTIFYQYSVEILTSWCCCSTWHCDIQVRFRNDIFFPQKIWLKPPDDTREVARNVGTCFASVFVMSVAHGERHCSFGTFESLFTSCGVYCRAPSKVWVINSVLHLPIEDVRQLLYEVDLCGLCWSGRACTLYMRLPS